MRNSQGPSNKPLQRTRYRAPLIRSAVRRKDNVTRTARRTGEREDSR